MIPNSVYFYCYWFGTSSTNWQAIKQEWNLTDEEIADCKRMSAADR